MGSPHRISTEEAMHSPCEVVDLGNSDFILFSKCGFRPQKPQTTPSDWGEPKSSSAIQTSPAPRPHDYHRRLTKCYPNVTKSFKLSRKPTNLGLYVRLQFVKVDRQNRKLFQTSCEPNKNTSANQIRAANHEVEANVISTNRQWSTQLQKWTSRGVSF